MIKKLFTTDWFTVKDKDGYVYIDNPYGAVLVLAFKASEDSNNPFLFLARKEPIPPHTPMKHLTALTGTVEKGEEYLETAIRELEEEAGIIAPSKSFIDLSYVYPSKASTTKVHMYAVDVTGLRQGVAKGDGSKWEQDSEVVWLNAKQAAMVPSAAYGAAMNRLHIWLGDNLFY